MSERFNNDGEEEMQSYVFNMQAMKTRPEILNNSDDEEKTQGLSPSYYELITFYVLTTFMY